jgi:hypothetical protein
MRNSIGAVHDPSVGDYAATSPFEWGGIFYQANSAPSYWM